VLTDIRALADQFLIALPNINKYINTDLPGYGTGRSPASPVPNPRHPAMLSKASTTGRAHRASGAAFSASLGTQTSSKLDLSKTKFVPLDLRTFSELPSARFTKCAPHLNLKPCLGQATHLMPRLIVRSKEEQSPKLL